VKPLLPLFSGDGVFFVLALSQSEIRLLQGTRYVVTQVELGALPESLSRIQKTEDREAHLDRYVPAGGARNAAIFYGTGAERADDSTKLLDYLREVDNGLRGFLKPDQAPLVLAGVNYLHSLYREVSSYSHIVETGISGNPEQMSLDELHAEAWQIVRPYFQQIRQAAKEHYRQLSGQDSHLVSDDLDTILPAALHGRIESLFVAVGAQQWGEFDPESARVIQHEDYRPGDEDLLDRAAILTLLNNGTVFAVR
jgi:hypothetical protein